MPGSFTIDRRSFLASATAAAALTGAGMPLEAFAAEGLIFGPAQPFSYAAFKARAKELAGKPYSGPKSPDPALLTQIDYDQHGRIRFKPELALFKDGPGQFPVTFFHLGQWFQKPVRMRVVEGSEGKQSAREIVYEPAYFDMPVDSPARKLKENAGFAGFRLQESRLGDQAKLPWQKNDWVAFLGASYFRAIGELYQYGLSARGVALNTTSAEAPEEFPDFTEIYFETPKDGADAITVYALLDGPSITGAYRFVMRRDRAVTMDIDADLHLRHDVFRFGIAPLTSMYWFSETVKQTAIDWRPEVHDSDGLALWTGAGERIWRPLNNPPRVAASAFSDNNPRGFGLMQRDRIEDHYLDGVNYERRPSAWIEPKGDWGRGSVQLIEIPTDDEIHDNINAMWVPAEPGKAGSSHAFSYRLHWVADEPHPPALARCIATRLGNGGVPGQARPKGVRKFMVEFLGGSLKDIPFAAKPEAVLTSSRGTFSYVFTEAVPDDVPGHWRAQFDLTTTGTEPVDMRCYLRLGDKVLTETWLYQYHPFG